MSGVPGMPLPSWAPELRPCGTPAAYRRHLRRGEPACEACRKAVARDWQDRQAAGWPRPPRPPRPRRVHLGTPGGVSMCGLVRRPPRVTDVLDEVTCERCLGALRRYLADERAREARRAA